MKKSENPPIASSQKEFFKGNTKKTQKIEDRAVADPWNARQAEAEPGIQTRSIVLRSCENPCVPFCDGSDVKNYPPSHIVILSFVTSDDDDEFLCSNFWF